MYSKQYSLNQEMKSTYNNGIEDKKSSDSLIFLGLLLFFVSEYFNPYAHFPPLKALHLSSILPLGVFFLWLTTGKKDNLYTPQSKILLALFFLVVFSLAHALVTRPAFDKVKQFGGYLLIYFVLIGTVTTADRFRKDLWSLIVIHAAIIAVNPKFVLEAGRTAGIRAGYFLGDGNDFSISVVILVPMAIFLLATERGKIKWLMICGLALVLLFAIVNAQSRASSIALFSMFCYLWFKSKRKIIGTIIFSGFILGLLIFASTDYFNRMQSVTEYEKDSSSQMRLVAWKAGIKMALDHPITGVGAGNFNRIYGRFYRDNSSLQFFAGARWISPHSSYIQCLTELGFPGIFLFFALFYYNFKYIASLRKKIKEDANKQHLLMLPTCLEMSCIGFMLNAAFLGVFYYPHIFVLSGIVVTACSIFSKQIPPSQLDSKSGVIITPAALSVR